MKLIKYVETVEVKTNSTTKTKFYFGEQPVLRNKRILYIETFNVGIVSESPSDLAVINGTVINKSFLVLVSKNSEVINRIPLLHLIPGTQSDHHILIDLIVDFPKSYVEVGSIASLNASETFLFTFYCNNVLEEIPEYRGVNVENIEVKTTPNSIHKFSFPDHENLRGKKIQFIDMLNTGVTMTPSGDSLINATVRKKSYLTIATKGQEIIRKIPVVSIRSANLYGFRIPFDNIEIDFPNSYFEIPDTADTVADEVFFLNIYYYDRIIGKKN